MKLETEATLTHGEYLAAVDGVSHPSCFGKTEAGTAANDLEGLGSYRATPRQFKAGL